MPSQLISPLCTYQLSQSIRKTACSLVPDLIKCVKISNQPIENLLNIFVDTFLGMLGRSQEPDQVSDIIDVLSGCFKLAEAPFMTAEVQGKISSHLVELLKKADQLIKKYLQDKVDEDNVEEDIKIINDDIKELESLYVDTFLMIGYIFKSHKEQVLDLAKLLLLTFVPILVPESAGRTQNKCAIYLIVDIVEHMSYESCADIWNNLVEIMVNYCTHKFFMVRQAACYGIGFVARKTPANCYSLYSPVILSQLFLAQNIPKETESDKSYGQCQDNVVSAIGKIIEFQHASINLAEVLDYWVKQLPLKFDKQESIYQTNFLLRIAIESPNVLFQSQSHYDLVIQIYAKVINSKLCTADITSQIKQSLLLLRSVPYVQ